MLKAVLGVLRSSDSIEPQLDGCLSHRAGNAVSHNARSGLEDLHSVTRGWSVAAINDELRIRSKVVEGFLKPLHFAVLVTSLPWFLRLAVGLEQFPKLVEPSFSLGEAIETAVDTAGDLADVISVRSSV